MEQTWPLARCPLTRPLPSLLSLIRPRPLRTKGGVCFYVGLFTSGVFLRVRVQVFDVQHASIRLRRPAYWPSRAFRKKACWARSWEERNRRERRAVILSLSISLLQLIILARSFSAALIWANHLTWLWTYELQHTWGWKWDPSNFGSVELSDFSQVFILIFCLPSSDYREILKLFKFLDILASLSRYALNQIKVLPQGLFNSTNPCSSLYYVVSFGATHLPSDLNILDVLVFFFSLFYDVDFHLLGGFILLSLLSFVTLFFFFYHDLLNLNSV